MKSTTKIFMTILLLMTTAMVSAQRVATTSDAERKELAKKTLALDYSMPDYSVKKIDAKVMGPRLAKILESLCANYTQPRYLNSLSLIQSKQVEGLNYGCIKTMKLENVTKTGNELTIRFNTILEPNNLNLKKSQLVFHFVDGVSEDTATNDFFCSLCRYLKE
jgi:hypothetical protein